MSGAGSGRAHGEEGSKRKFHDDVQASRGTLIYYLALLAIPTLVALIIAAQLFAHAPDLYPLHPAVVVFIALWGCAFLWAWYLYNPYFVKLKHTRGGISVFNHIDGFHEFVMRVKTASRKVTVKGL